MSREGRKKGYYVRGKRGKRKKSSRKNPQELGGTSISEGIPTISYEDIDIYFKQPNKITLSEEDENKLLLGKEAWDKSLNIFHNPAIPNPKFVFDQTKTLGFFIELNTWQTVMNLANSPTLVLDSEILNYYHALAVHEISHYVFCPYDNLTNARLIRAAQKKVSERHSPAVVNFFSDLLVDKKNHRKIPKIMEWELQQTYKMSNSVGRSKEEKNHSKFWKTLVKSYEIMWNFDLNLPIKEYEEITPIAKKIVNTIMKNFEDFSLWEKKVTRIAGLLKDFLLEEFQPNRGRKPNQGEDDIDSEFSPNSINQTGSNTEVPLDVQIAMGNPFEIKTKAKKRQEDNETRAEKQKDAETLAQEMSLIDFVKMNRTMGLVAFNQAIATYYRGISKNLMEIKIVQKRPSGSIPIGIETWRVGDPIEKLDVLQSMLVSPAIIPNLTTRKWIVKDGPGIEDELQLPDLFLVIDSSGSMNWDPYSKSKKKQNSPFHLALIASFAALHYALKKGSKVAALNFSEHFRKEDFSRNHRKIEKILLSYQGMGTILPIKEVKRMCKNTERRSLIILITDFDIGNWEESYSDLMEIIQMGNKIIGFFIGGNKSELNSKDFKELSEKGAKFYPINQIDDLIGLVIKEIKEVYD
ncbi:MAG: VWA domain-containing protein [archaeon]|nr:VWA domain-containing protein [archaeon]